MKARLVLTAAATLLVAPAALAQVDYTTDGNNLDLTPFDDTYDGSLGSMAALTLNVGDNFTIGDINVTLDLAHTWAGDLTIKIMSPNGTLVDLVSRAGYTEAGDDGAGCCGVGSDLVLGSAYVFDDAAGSSSEDIGIGGDDPINPFTLHSSGFGNTHGLTTLNGESSGGVWTVYIGDGAGGDNGTFDGFTLTITEVPAPGALALLGVAGLAARRRRRA